MSDVITNLEVKVAYLEKTIAEYNELFTELYDRIDWLQREIKRIEEEQSHETETFNYQDERPPHY